MFSNNEGTDEEGNQTIFLDEPLPPEINALVRNLLEMGASGGGEGEEDEDTGSEEGLFGRDRLRNRDEFDPFSQGT